MDRRTSPLRIVAIATALSLLASACGDAGDSEDTPGETAEPVEADEGESDEGAGADEASAGQYSVSDECTTSEILNRLADMDADEREAELQEVAEGEGTLTYYASMGTDDHTFIADAFREYSGIEVAEHNGSPEGIHQRFFEEVRANRSEVDVLEQAGPFLILAEREGVLAEYNGPSRDDLQAAANISPYWVGERFVVLAPAWNTDALERDDLPDDVRGFAEPEWEGRFGIDASDWDWGAGIWTWMSEEGMSDDEIDQWFTDYASNAIVTDGGPLLVELTGVGEVEVAVPALTHIVERHLRAEPETPLEWEPVINPVLVRPSGSSIPCDAPNPASAILFLDWLISSETQTNVIVDGIHRPPASREAEGGMLDESTMDIVAIDLELVVDDEDFWADRWNQYMAGR